MAIFLLALAPLAACNNQQSEGSIHQAQATLSNTVPQLDNEQQLMTSSATAQTNVDNARATRDTAAAQLAPAQAA